MEVTSWIKSDTKVHANKTHKRTIYANMSVERRASFCLTDNRQNHSNKRVKMQMMVLCSLCVIAEFFSADERPPR